MLVKHVEIHNMKEKERLSAVNIPWRLEAGIETRIFEEKDKATFKCLGNFGFSKGNENHTIKHLRLYFDVYYSISVKRIIDNSYFDNKRFIWDSIPYRDLFVNNPLEWNKTIFDYMRIHKICPDPFVYIIENSIALKEADISENRKKNFNHFLFLGDEFHTEIIAEGSLKWKVIY